jgi:photosystem II stability/assembly factor-like uncharacterized protein
MKQAIYFFSFLLLAGFLSGCKKENQDEKPVEPAEKKKYAWACGQPDSTGYGLILFSPDGGETWQRQGAGSPVLLGVDIVDIWAVDENNVWAAGTGNTLLKTSDGGLSWQKCILPDNPANPALLSISIMNKTSIWVSGSAGTVYHSPDNGSTWTLCNSTFFNNAFLQGIHCVSSDKVYVVGGIDVGGAVRGYAAYTVNRGQTWDTISPADDYNRHEWIGACSAGNTIVIYGAKAHYMVSTDGGITWNNDSVPQTGGMSGADINHLIMHDAQTWWGAFDMGQIFLTTNGGNGWTSQETGQSAFFMMGIDAWDRQLALSVGAPAGPLNNCPIIKTSNGGASWEKKYTTSGATLAKVSFIRE